MVNTRKKVVPSESTDLPASPAPTTTRSTRRSLGAAPVSQVLTPTRRSRRLSNSSVESISNDNANPVVAPTRTRRSIRGKPTSDSETEEIEVLTIKKRKVADQAGALGSIIEDAEVTKETVASTKADETLSKISPIVVDLDKEIQLEEPKNLPDEKNTTSETEVVDLFSEEETTPTPAADSVTVTDGNVSSALTISEDTETKETVLEETILEEVTEITHKEIEKEADKMEETISEELSEIIPNKIEKEADKMEETISEEVTEITPDETEKETDKPQDTNVDMASNDAASLKSEKVQAVLDRIKEFNSLEKVLPDKQQLKKKKNQKTNRPLKKKKVAQTVSAQENPVKVPLPCGADIMKNIPRGKSVSGREWKAPKSNPRYLYKDKGLKMPLAKHQQLKAERTEVRELENRMKEEERARRVDLAARKELNKKRTEENARKAEVVQVIRNTNKIKRMNKKQLKLIQKRDTSE